MKESVPTRRLLLVDDAPAIRLIGSVSLRRMAGWEVTTATGGVEALERVANDPPDLLLLDVELP